MVFGNTVNVQSLSMRVEGENRLWVAIYFCKAQVITLRERQLDSALCFMEKKVVIHSQEHVNIACFAHLNKRPIFLVTV